MLANINAAKLYGMKAYHSMPHSGAPCPWVSSIIPHTNKIKATTYSTDDTRAKIKVNSMLRMPKVTRSPFIFFRDKKQILKKHLILLIAILMIRSNLFLSLYSFKPIASCNSRILASFCFCFASSFIFWVSMIAFAIMCYISSCDISAEKITDGIVGCALS